AGAGAKGGKAAKQDTPDPNAAQDGQQDGQADESVIPLEFPSDQLFVAVTETASEYAGHDGGPIKGGRGLWAKGAVGEWTSSAALPLALRDPETGMIWKGYLEPVLK